MRKLLLAGVPLAVALVGWLPSVAVGQVPGEDSVVGYLEIFRGSNDPPERFILDVHSGPSGENPRNDVGGGSFALACLHVRGNTAVVGYNVGDQGAFFFSLLDASVDKWTVAQVPGPAGSDDCKTRFSPPGGDRIGDFVITDAVGETTPPVLTVPSGIVVNASVPLGARVTYSASATDNLDTSPAVVCSPPSGAIFPIGSTKVTCTATDDAGNTATESFNVVVRVGAAPDQDYVSGNGNSNCGPFSISALSGPIGENPAGQASCGTLYSGRVTCLNVQGDVALLTVSTQGFGSVAVRITDGGPFRDRVESFPGSGCAQPQPSYVDQDFTGDIVVHDALPLPSTKEQCKNGGWRNYGDLFKNQGACVSFVATGGKRRS